MYSIIVLLLVLLFAPSAAFAYLDPGSGAVLVNLLIAGVAALIFSLKGVFLRLIGKGDKLAKEDKKERAQVGILSEGKQYHATFEPLVQALIDNEISFDYYTLDIEDKILDIESDYMHPRFLGYGNIGFHRAGSLNVKNLICTTPNIGSKAYPIAKSPKVENLIHVFHSINDLSMYRKGSLDHYDTVFMVGDFQAQSIRELEKKRDLKEKTLVSLGIPYLDKYKDETVPKPPNNERKTVLIASSWGSKGLFENYGIDFIKNLSAEGYDIIVRPHPQSYVSEPATILKIENELKQKISITWDREISPSASMQKADLLISDTSSIRFDFAFLYQKPIISLEIPQDAMPGFERDDMSELWMEGAAKQIGIQVDKTTIGDISLFINDILQKHDQEKSRAYRDQTIANFGKAGEAMAKYIKAEIMGEKQ